MIVVGIFYVLMVYAATVGYGPEHMATGFGNDAAPFDTLGRAFGGPTFALLIDVVGIASFFGAALAIINGGARILYAASREGALPRWLTWTHPTRGTPVAGVAMLCGIGLAIGLGLAPFLAPFVAFAFLGAMDAMLVLLIYVLVNISCILFFVRKRRA